MEYDLRDDMASKLRVSGKALDYIEIITRENIELNRQLEEAEKVIDFYASDSVMEYLSTESFIMEVKNNGNCIGKDKGKRAKEYKEKYMAH